MAASAASAASGPPRPRRSRSAAQQAPQLPPAAQVALRLAPLRVGPDGTHQLTIHLNPEELGPISVVAQVRGDELSVRLTGTGAGADALKAALPELEQQLRDGGFTTVAVDVREAPRLDQALRPAWADRRRNRQRNIRDRHDNLGPRRLKVSRSVSWTNRTGSATACTPDRTSRGSACTTRPASRSAAGQSGHRSAPRRRQPASRPTN